MKKHSAILAQGILLMASAYAQEPAPNNNYQTITTRLKDISLSVDTTADLISARAFNRLIQEKVGYYLSGTSDLSLYKTYATYSTEGDKLTFGFNFAHKSSTGRLQSLFNPMIETGLKNNFSTLYKKDKWQADIRAGFRWTLLIPSGTSIQYRGFYSYSPKNQQIEMINARHRYILELHKKLQAEAQASSTSFKELVDKIKEVHKKNLEEGQQEKQAKGEDHFYKQLLKQLEDYKGIDQVAYSDKFSEYEEGLSDAEVKALRQPGAYNTLTTWWLSIWGFYPVTERETYISADVSDPFHAEKFDPWELNIQGNWLHEWKLGVSLVTLSHRVYQNNTAMAELMTPVDYEQYANYPGEDPLKRSVLESNKAYTGKYNEFTTNCASLQLAHMFSLKTFFNIGASAKLEQNFGEYSALHLRLGIPLSFKGKEKPVNIEPQIRWNNLNNYANAANYKSKPIVGVNVGLPFSTLFK